jgi:threonine synthase
MVSPAALAGRTASLWRYRELLPLAAEAEPVTLGEGWTPLIPAERVAKQVGLRQLWIKDESQNPTGTFKARGMSMAVSLAKQLGATKLAAPSAGNAGGALAAYAAGAGLECHLFMPRDTPSANVLECRATGAQVSLIDGLITDCGREVARRKDVEGWFDVSTLKEPYRLEGKKTMGYELAEQLQWNLPEVIIYPTGGGTGLIGMWKAFEEFERLGWIDSRRPKMVAVQAEGCRPIVTAFERGTQFAEEHPNASTKASGLRVPQAIGDFLILEVIRNSHGRAIAVSDQAMIDAALELGRLTGIFVAPEGGACYAGLKHLIDQRWLRAEDRVVLLNTGTGLKYGECFETVGREFI